MATDTSVSWTPDQFLSSELNLDPNVSRNLVELFENGNEVAFIARYRRHLTNNISSDQLRYALEAFNTAKTLKTKAEKLIKRAETEIEDVHQKNEIKAALSRTMDSYELDSIFQPFKKTKKGTLASRAMELGVGDVAEQIFQGKRVDLKRYITENPALNSYDKVEMEVSNVLSERLHRMEETQSFIRKICELENYCGLRMEVTSSLSKKAKALKEGDKDFQLIDHFKLYISFSKEARYVLPYQVLALERAASLGIITWKIKVDERIATYHPGLRLDFHPSHCVLLKKIVTDSTKRFLIPNIERNIKRRLSAAAERSAIDCFAKNVRQLMLTAPLKGYEVLAIDPGYSNGCKCALVDENGNVLSTDVFYLRLDRGRNVWCMDHHAEKLVKTLVTKSSHRRIVIAIGNGTASQPTQQAIASLIRRNVFSPVEAKFCVVSESGASIYSVTPLAESELPGMDPNLRSAVSLARRIIDPISEYVKIAPKHLGVGSYQHSVNEKRLDDMLDIVVRECVSTVGVDVNVASPQLLQKVSGLNKKTVDVIVKYRQSKGRIASRDVIRNMKGIGPKTFEQCAGFLFVYNECGAEEPPKKRKKSETNWNPLDSTAVHPESYKIAEEILSLRGLSPHDVNGERMNTLNGLEHEMKERGHEWITVWELLTRPVVVTNPPRLLTEAKTISDLQQGDIVEGVVMNHAQFGLFIDVGIGFNVLAHHSSLPPEVPQVNDTVKVKIQSIDLARKRVSVIIL